MARQVSFMCQSFVVVKKEGRGEYKKLKEQMWEGEKKEQRGIGLIADVGWDWKKGWLCLVKAIEIMSDIASV